MAVTWAGVAWAASTAYVVSARVVNGGNVYVCATAGTSASSGGPTGTTSPITDGTVTWTYLGAAGGTVVDVDAKLADVTASAQNFFLTLACKLVADAYLWGDLQDNGQAFLAAHYGELWLRKGNGQVTSEAVGALSRGYAALTGPFDVDKTNGGLLYMGLVRTLPTTMGLVI